MGLAPFASHDTQSSGADPVSFSTLASTEGLSNAFGAICFLNERVGWVINGTDLFVTEDGGTHWVKVAAAPDNITRLNFVDRNNGWAFTADYEDPYSSNLQDFRILHTSDGGRKWETQLTVPATGQLLQFCQSLRSYDAENAFALLGDKLYRTTDGGSSWLDITPSVPGFVLQQMSFISTDSGWVSGNLNSGTAAVYKTTDAGATWSAQWLLTDTAIPPNWSSSTPTTDGFC